MLVVSVNRKSYCDHRDTAGQMSTRHPCEQPARSKGPCGNRREWLGHARLLLCTWCTSQHGGRGACAWSPSARMRPRVPLSRTFPDLLLVPPSHFLKEVSLSFPSLTLLLISEAQMFLKPVSLSVSAPPSIPGRRRQDDSLTAAVRQPDAGEAARATVPQRMLCNGCANFRTLASPG